MSAAYRSASHYAGRWNVQQYRSWKIRQRNDQNKIRDILNIGTNARLVAVLHLKSPGQSAYTTTGLQPLVTPAYSLQTSATAYDS